MKRNFLGPANRRELAVANRRLGQETARRKVAEQSLKHSKQHYGQLLAQSRQMQEQIRQLARQIILAQEEERHHISRELHNEIAQTLLGINVRLLSLKQEVRNHSAGIKRKIASTQRLVVKSVSSVRRVAREITS